MPSGIILSSGSQGATQEAIEKVMKDNGYEPEQGAVAEPTEATEPKREDFDSDDAFAEAQAEFEAKEEEAAAKAEEEEERKEQERPRLTRNQKRIEKATRELKEENRKLHDRLAALEGKSKPEPVKEPEAPKRENFKTDEEFDEAKFQHRYKVQREREKAEDAKKSFERQLQANFEDYKTAVAEFKDTHDDWDEVVDSSIAVPEAVYYAIVDLGKDGPRVTYHLGQHPDILDQLAEMTPYRAAIEVGRLADKLKSGQKPTNGQKPSSAGRTTKPRPTVPEPVKPVSTSATTSTLTSAEAAKKRDFRAFKVAQRAGR